MISSYLLKVNFQPRIAGKIDYVAGWYYKAASYLDATSIRAAFVSTNSIIQGEQVTTIWKPITGRYNINIDFGYRTFIWSNEARGKAAVHCVIVGFSQGYGGQKYLFDGDIKEVCDNISPYLVKAPTVFIQSRKQPICSAPEMITGNRLTDGGHLIINRDELFDFITIEPNAKQFIRPYKSSIDFINNVERYVLYLKGCNPSDIKKMPKVIERVEKVALYRSKSTKDGTKQKASTPTLFDEERIPDSTFLLIPRVSSEKRKYIPMGYVAPDVIVSDSTLMIPEASLYHFGILTSHVHMVWVRAIAGRLKSDYRYSKDIVYNNFPWPEPTEQQKMTIGTAAQQVLDARALFPESSLADLYDPLTMPPELTKAHNNLDRAVVAAYGGPGFTTEAERVAELMRLYKQLA